MKKILTLFVILALSRAELHAQYPDLPGNGLPYNVQTLTSGSLIIAMDNTNQPGSGVFNLRAYGLAVRLLDNNKKLKWVIKPGKLKDGIDFSVNSQLLTTSATTTTTTVTRSTSGVAGASTVTVTSNAGIQVGMKLSGQNALQANTYVIGIAGNTITISGTVGSTFTNKNVDYTIVTHPTTAISYGTASVRDFRSGPFVIQSADTAGVTDLVAGFNAEIGAPVVRVYRTTADVSVDVRYDYNRNGVIWKPKTAILDDGGKADIHAGYMDNAAVSGHNGFSNWTIETTPAFVTGCYTFATEPHNDNAPDIVIQGIRQFVQNGGNFLAECAAVRTYELSTFARFQSTNGFDNANENKIPAVQTFSNMDLSYMQINGAFDMSEGGSLIAWRVPSALNGNLATNNFHYFLSGMATNPVDRYTNTSVSKLLASNVLGGMVFYLGSHTYDGTSAVQINGQRAYLNAMMTPTDPQGSLNTAAVVVCSKYPDPIVVNTSNPAGPTAAYPVVFNLYEDVAPAGYDANDIFIDSRTYTAPGVVTGGNPQMQIPALQNASKNFLVRIVPASGCLQEKVLIQGCSTLPVDLMAFMAKRNTSTTVELKWTTQTEQNNKGFYIEKQDGNSGAWTTVSFVNSQAQNGSSSSPLNYTFYDANNSKGMTQYRLRQVDFDSKFKYSEIRSVKGTDQKGSLIVYPNPSSDGKVNLVFDDANVVRDIAVMDMTGRTVKSMKNVTSNSVQIENLTAGMYTVRVYVPASGEQTVQKFVVNKR